MCFFANIITCGHYSTFVLFMQIFSQATNAEKTLFSLLSAARPVPVTKWMGMGSSFASLPLRLPSVSLRAQARDLRPGEAHDIASLEEACR